MNGIGCCLVPGVIGELCSFEVIKLLWMTCCRNCLKLTSFGGYVWSTNKIAAEKHISKDHKHFEQVFPSAGCTLRRPHHTRSQPFMKIVWNIARTATTVLEIRNELLSIALHQRTIGDDVGILKSTLFFPFKKGSCGVCRYIYRLFEQLTLIQGVCRLGSRYLFADLGGFHRNVRVAFTQYSSRSIKCKWCLQGLSNSQVRLEKKKRSFTTRSTGSKLLVNDRESRAGNYTPRSHWDPN